MSHKLEEYLKRERDNLDVESPDLNAVWDRIDNKMSQRTAPASTISGRTRWSGIRNIAAAAIILFALGYITKDIIDTFSEKKAVTLASIDSSLGRREKQYKTMVSYRIEEVKTLPVTNEEIVKEMYKEIEKLDTIYRQSMNDLKVLGPNEKIINTIFDTYEQRIRLLELIILETNKIKNHENNENINL